MIKHFLCMANSYKNGGRCIAGIELQYTPGDVRLVRENHIPKWIRPVGEDDVQGVSEMIVKGFSILDILEIDVIESVPKESHVENVLFRSIKKVGRLKKSKDNIACLCDNYHNLIFGNRGKAVIADKFSEVGYSLMIIEPRNINIESYIDDNNHESYRVHFSYNSNNYVFKLTDPIYIDTLRNKPDLHGERNDGELFLSLSLGVNHEGWHYKLVAGVIDMTLP